MTTFRLGANYTLRYHCHFEITFFLFTDDASTSSTPAPVENRTESLQHVNFFADLEAGETTHTENKDREKEKKQEQEEYEKKIGLLTYLGQDTHELTGE